MNQYLEVVSELLADAPPSEGAISRHTNAVQLLVRVQQRMAQGRLVDVREVIELLVTSVIARAKLLNYARPSL